MRQKKHCVYAMNTDLSEEVQPSGNELDRTAGTGTASEHLHEPPHERCDTTGVMVRLEGLEHEVEV